MPAHRFDEREGATVAEIGQRLKITRQRANRIEIDAIRKLWNDRLWMEYVQRREESLTHTPQR